MLLKVVLNSPPLEGWQKFKEFVTGWLWLLTFTNKINFLP